MNRFVKIDFSSSFFSRKTHKINFICPIAEINILFFHPHLLAYFY